MVEIEIVNGLREEATPEQLEKRQKGCVAFGSIVVVVGIILIISGIVTSIYALIGPGIIALAWGGSSALICGRRLYGAKRPGALLQSANNKTTTGETSHSSDIDSLQ